MPDASSILNVTSVYSGVAAILFSVWYPSIESSLNKPRPDDIRNSAKYVSGIRSDIISKSIPLCIFLFSYVVSLAYPVWLIFFNSRFSISDSDPAITLVILLYLFMFYMAGISVNQAISLIARWVHPVKNSTRTSPRIS